VAAQARAADLPLPGGVPGTSVAVHPLLTAELLVPPTFAARPEGRFPVARALLAGRDDWMYVPVGAFLIEHPGAGMVLVDTGLPSTVATDPSPTLGTRFTLAVRDARMEPGQAVAGQLRARGLEPSTVGVVVMTNLQFDHAGAVAEVPEATYVVDRREWNAAGAGGFTRGYRRQLVDHASDWRTVDFDAQDVDAFAGFGRSLDLFGDGSLRLVATPGHSPGHLSVIVRLRDRELVLAGDAAPSRANIESGRPGLFVADEHLYRRSLRELQRYLEITPDAMVICSHDAELWPGLEAVYT